MSNNGTLDPAAQIAALREQGVEQLQQLRREAGERRAELAKIDAEETARLQAAETEFAAQLAEQEHQQRVAQVTEAHNARQTEYDTAAEAASEAIVRVDTLIADLADAFRDAATAELHRCQVGESHRLAWKAQAAPLDIGLGEPAVADKRLIVHDRSSSLFAARQISANVHEREVEATMTQLWRHESKRFGDFAYVQGQRVEL